MSGSPRPIYVRHPALLLLPLVFILFFLVASRFIDPFAVVSQKGPLGGDTFGGAEIFLKLKYEWKRPLMGPVVWAATSLFRLIPGVAPPTAMALGLALLATLNMALAYLAACRLTSQRTLALLATACYALFLSTLVGLSITDSYTVSSLAVLLVLYVWLGDPSPSDLRGCLRLGAAIGLAGLCNMPLLALAALPVIHALLGGELVRALRQAMVVGAMAAAMVAAVVLIHAELKHGTPGAYLARSSEYNARYADPERLLEPEAHARVGAAFFAFAIAAPEPSVPGRGLEAEDIWDYLAGPGGLAGLAAVIAVNGLAAAAILGRHRRFALPILAVLGAITIFYVYFNPPDAMLYSIQLRPVLFVLMALGALSLPLTPRRSRLVLVVLMTLLAMRNLPIALAAPYDFAVKSTPRELQWLEASTP